MIINPYRFAVGGGAPWDGFGEASRDFDGNTQYIEIADTDDLSFGDGSTDSPFSIAAWVKMHDATHFKIATKFSAASGTLQEWQFVLSGGDTLYLILYDSSANASQGRFYSTALTSFENSWIHLAATYDGTGGATAHDGIRIYLTELGGSTSRVDDADSNSNNYVAMENLAAEFLIGRRTTEYANGLIADVRVYGDVLTSGEVQDLADGIHHDDNLVGWWKLNETGANPTFTDYSVNTNDGTNNGTTESTDGPAD
jgi:hypothetical protein